LDSDDQLAGSWQFSDYPYGDLMGRKAYEAQEYHLQVELLQLQAWTEESGQLLVILFEGRDADGKGGTIERFMEYLNPGAPTSWPRGNRPRSRRASSTSSATSSTSPLEGRSCSSTGPGTTGPVSDGYWGSSPDEVAEFVREAPEFERNLTKSGMYLVTSWFFVSRDGQRRCFLERERHPLAQWKLSPIDPVPLDRWDDYTEAKRAMVTATDSDVAPWGVVRSDCKKRAPLNAIC
jgi:polyphosphate kinase 2 (PPK2 family)